MNKVLILFYLFPLKMIKKNLKKFLLTKRVYKSVFFLFIIPEDVQ